MEQERGTAMPRAIHRVVYAARGRNTGLVSDGMNEKERGTGMIYPEEMTST
jgi:hypothetical protein